MASDEHIEASAFMASFKGFMDQVVAQAPPSEEPIFLRRLREHFAAEPTSLPIVSEEFAKSEHPNLHLALTDYLRAEDRSSELLGLTSPNEPMGIKLAQLTQRGDNEWTRPREGPVAYVNIMLNDDRVLACVQSGLHLIRDGTQRLAVLVRGPTEHSWRQSVSIEVMASDSETAEAFLSTLRRAMRQRNVYRGQVISLEPDQGGISVKFHRLPSIARNGVILPQGVLERIERHTVGFARHAAKLRAAGRHLKRGLLLYGPPGTGKTLTAMYLAAQMPDRTIILLTGTAIGLLEPSYQMARLLAPATIILEDVDLIAEERTQQGTGANVLLFELLNQMDGLADDADILFLLTTNRPELLEPALAARPGRIDQAIAVPLPDRDCRQRLIDLYSHGMTVRLQEGARLLDQTESVSAAFIRELLRKAAVVAADDGGELVVEDRHIAEAMHELVVAGGELTQQLLGAGSAFATKHARDSCA